MRGTNDKLIITTVLIVVVSLMCMMYMFGQISPRPVPTLIGHNCIGAGGDIWAMEESDFPTECEQIERY